MVSVPLRWYNIAADLPEPLPPLRDPEGLREESRIALLSRILPSRLIEDEYILARWVDIPGEVRKALARIGRPTPLIRAEGLEKVLGVKGRVRIYYKSEAVLPTGSHKINTAIAQAYYAKLDGAKEIVTETGAGQWGLAASTAAALMGLKATVFMTASSFKSKIQRRLLMEAQGARVISSPSKLTDTGREALEEYGSTHPGSLGLAIAEAVEYTLESGDRRYLPGSVLEAVLMHQTVIGLEALDQLPEEPDVVVACVGGGSNFGGFTYPMIGARLRGEGFEKTRFIAAESTAAPKLTRGEYRYDGLDSSLILPLAKMYTLGHRYTPPPSHAAGLRYHGVSPSLSILRRLGLVEAEAIPQEEALASILLMARSEGVVPAPESSHAVALAARIARKLPDGSVVAFNLSGHGLLDLDALQKALEIRGASMW
ncbi:tryptophan synthase beta chain [Aeropyrum pernix K1]|uniref:Tryptophan synthase beta chain 1 n=1 Tax=Aeropyrum pernix (strain ATCC 700893 / DSM 11879 / JCM 9820 / NBRC 100138 / K1) TaxID=272557 RepID=TRPB1_AERPE|nr:TrpB-like pyridoxal phosphate-dependent enzyme [Aeropyrum pernix]Q9Y8T5.1 RecName: Full=Tryptophan synthase beta chain 1 [Aeropyrum pernix K1]BAA81565.1 tryptophan synthase beta chain [Aeropyrum pernix K1]